MGSNIPWPDHRFTDLTLYLPARDTQAGTAPIPVTQQEVVSRATADPIHHNHTFATQADAPACHECGSIMVRNGSCYRCLNCGATSGCS